MSINELKDHSNQVSSQQSILTELITQRNDSLRQIQGSKILPRSGIEPCTSQFSASCHNNECTKSLTYFNVIGWNNLSIIYWNRPKIILVWVEIQDPWRPLNNLKGLFSTFFDTHFSRNNLVNWLHNIFYFFHGHLLFRLFAFQKKLSWLFTRYRQSSSIFVFAFHISAPGNPSNRVSKIWTQELGFVWADFTSLQLEKIFIQTYYFVSLTAKYLSKKFVM